MSSFSNTSNNPYRLGWETARDPSTGNVYYFHRDSGLTSWEWPPPMVAGMGWETSAASAPAAAIGAAGAGAFSGPARGPGRRPVGLRRERRRRRARSC